MIINQKSIFSIPEYALNRIEKTFKRKDKYSDVIHPRLYADILNSTMQNYFYKFSLNKRIRDNIEVNTSPIFIRNMYKSCYSTHSYSIANKQLIAVIAKEDKKVYEECLISYVKTDNEEYLITLSLDNDDKFYIYTNIINEKNEKLYKCNNCLSYSFKERGECDFCIERKGGNIIDIK